MAIFVQLWLNMLALNKQRKKINDDNASKSDYGKNMKVSCGSNSILYSYQQPIEGRYPAVPFIQNHTNNIHVQSNDLYGMPKALTFPTSSLHIAQLFMYVVVDFCVGFYIQTFACIVFAEQYEISFQNATFYHLLQRELRRILHKMYIFNAIIKQYALSYLGSPQ